MHFLAIREGKIAFACSATTVRAPILFDSDDEAADAIAQAIMDTRITAMSLSSSCSFPADDGRPDFNMDAFYDLVGRKLRESGFRLDA